MNEWLQLQSISKGIIGPGGMCEVLACPIDWIKYFPRVNPNTQTVTDKIQLITGKAWLAFSLTSQSRSFKEQQESSAAGIFFKQTVSGILTGQNEGNHLVLNNMIPYKWIVVCRERNTGCTYLVGDIDGGARLKIDYESKKGTVTELIFSNQSKYRALLYGNTFSTIPGTRPQTFIIQMLVEFRIGDPGRAVDGDVQMIIPELANKPKIAIWIDGVLVSQQGYNDVNACTYDPANNKITTTFLLADRSIIQIYEVDN
jgi:hypothetical protein